jgi:hypothetical protein
MSDIYGVERRIGIKENERQILDDLYRRMYRWFIKTIDLESEFVNDDDYKVWEALGKTRAVQDVLEKGRKN